jgi:aryl-alcohol dehydrogenase-like predicted oxidoreductase
MMKYRALGRTGLKVSEIGFGTWGIGGRTAGATSYGKTDDDVSRQALNAAFDLGINFFDTANVYGDGQSEVLLGDVFAERRGDVVIATKAGFSDYQSPHDFSSAAVCRSLEGSLGRLRSDYVDMLMLHNPDPDDPELEGTFSRLADLKQAGQLKAIGVSVRGPEDCAVLLERFGLDALQINLNLMDQRAIDSGAFEQAQAAGCSIIARTPLCFGFLSSRLSGEVSFDQSDHRSRWPKEQLEKWQQGRALFSASLAAKSDNSISLAALRFCITHPAVAAVIPGIIKPEEARQNARASDLGAFSESDFAEIRKIYADNSFFVERPEQKLAMADK